MYTKRRVTQADVREQYTGWPMAIVQTWSNSQKRYKTKCTLL